MCIRDSFQSAMYNAYAHLMYPLGLAILLWPRIIFGKGDSFLNVLKTPFLIILGKTTFGVYLVHFTVIALKTVRIGSAPYFGHREMIMETLNSIVFSFLAGTGMHLLVEMPFANLEGLVLRKPRPAKRDNKKDILLD
eukprot:TRINITY_DN7203_c0_g1_i4.p3 TRINITY_DN7203_c0_g1~~TRINITY_DN7203_c0_g1_i4.p3  ORF type:complete len:152 (+),score=14.29 TRINITY_DN7203_c0_g1_i4:47-457(+)